MSYWINFHLTFLLFILGYKKFIYTLYHMHYHINMMLITWLSNPHAEELGEGKDKVDVDVDAASRRS